VTGELRDRLLERWWAAWATVHPDEDSPVIVCDHIAKNDSESMVLCAAHPYRFMCAVCYDGHALIDHPVRAECEACEIRPATFMWSQELPPLRLPIRGASPRGYTGYRARLPLTVAALAWLCDERECRAMVSEVFADQT
jgi:hypothetical protein